MNLGINPSQNLPDQLGGVQVKFDGVPAAILAIAPGQVIVAPPDSLGTPDARRTGIPDHRIHTAAGVFTSVQLLYNGVPSNAVWMPVSNSLAGLLTLDFPNWAPDADGNVRNQDGTQNSASNPAAAGSTITLFATGLGATNPAYAAGSIARVGAASLLTPVFSSWETANPFQLATSETISFVPGFVAAMLGVQVQVPAQGSAGRVSVRVAASGTAGGCQPSAFQYRWRLCEVIARIVWMTRERAGWPAAIPRRANCCVIWHAIILLRWRNSRARVFSWPSGIGSTV